MRMSASRRFDRRRTRQRVWLGGMTDNNSRALEIHEITFDARDPHVLATFWGALLEREIRPGDMPQDDSVLVVATAGQLGLLFLRVPEGMWTAVKKHGGKPERWRNRSPGQRPTSTRSSMGMLIRARLGARR
jgi:hypothetical protein